VSAANVYTSYNWAGNVADSHTYTDVDATWAIPHAGTGSADRFTYSTAWVGLGTGSSAGDELVQAGSESDGGNPGTYYTWLEVYPDLPTEYYLNGALPGDVIYVHVTASSTQGS
jgi:hypothetical protein